MLTSRRKDRREGRERDGQKGGSTTPLYPIVLLCTVLSSVGNTCFKKKNIVRSQNFKLGDFPGGPAVKNPPFNAGFNPWSGN